MVFSILEPVFAGVLVSLINRYLLNGSAGTWLQSWCVPDENIDEDEVLDEEDHSMSSTSTTILDTQIDAHTHVH